MPVFACHLEPPRPDFATTMSTAEAGKMAEHVRHWMGLRANGQVIAFGPVDDPGGLYSLALVEAADLAAIDAVTAADPVTRADLGLRYRCAPMLQAILHPAIPTSDASA